MKKALFLLLLAITVFGVVYQWEGKLPIPTTKGLVRPGGYLTTDTYETDTTYWKFVGDSLGMTWVVTVDTLNFVPADTASVVFSLVEIKTIDKIVISTSGGIWIYNNHRTQAPDYLGADLILTLENIKQRTRVLKFTAVDTARVIVNTYNRLYEDNKTR